MGRIKHTKTELKAQREALRRYERFLPMLQLKKQQLQMELRQIEARREAFTAQEAALRTAARPWAGLLAGLADGAGLVRVAAVVHGQANIAGVAIPILHEVRFANPAIDLFASPPWHDEAQELGERLVRLRAERAVLDEQYRLLAEELRTTSQRVNLFEKVKIPECREHIRVIRIFLGDEQTAGVARAKFAKALTAARQRQEAGA